MKLLVTGGLGFIGSNFIRHVLGSRKDVEVVNLDLCTYAGNPANLAGVEDDRRYRFVKGDIADAKAVDKVMAGVDAVVNFAAETHVDRSILDAAAFLRTNVIGVQVLLDAALKRKVPRFVHVGTDEVYGSVEKGFSKEGDRLEPSSPYAASKAAADLLARSYFVTHQAPVIVTRASNNFGPYQYPEKALPLMITNWLDALPFPLYGDGRQVRDWLYVVDHCRAIELVLDKGQPGQTYNIGGLRQVANRELVELVRQAMGLREALVAPVEDRKGHDRRYALDWGKLKALGFRHAHPFEEALRLTVEWYRCNQPWWRALRTEAGYKAYYLKQYKERLKAGTPR